MATYYVATTGTDSPSNGTSGSPWKTLTYANDRIAANDIVKIKPGTYTERLIITKANTTWEHDGTAGTVYISGGYTPAVAWNGTRTRRPDAVSPLAGSNWAAGGGTPLVSVAASGVTIDGGSKWGIVIRHVAGRGLQVEWGGNNATIQNVRTDYCYEGGVRIFASDVLMEDCCVTRSGLQVYDPTRLFGGIPVALMVATIENTTTGTKYPENITVRGTLVQCNWGEGIAAGYGTRYVTIEECEASTNTHVNFYGNCSRDAIFRRNLAWFVVVPDITTRVQGGIAIADECGRLGKLPVNRRHCLNPQIYNNVTIGCAFGIDLRAGGTPDDRCRNEYGYTMNQATKAVGFYVGYNTVVATANSLGCIRMSTPYDDSTTQTSSLIENNVFERVGTTVAIAAAGVGHTWRNNVWRATPVARAQGSGDVVANPGLEAPNYTLPSIPFDKESTDFTPVSIYDTIDFFELKSGSPAIGAASNGSAAGGVTPPSITTDFYSASRGSNPKDCGAHEFGGTPTEPGELAASFTQSATSGTAPLSVTLTDTSTSDGTITSRAWDFGDGSTSTATNPTHIYSAPGVYTPSLAVQDSNGLDDTATGSAITVQQPDAGSGGATTYDIKRFTAPTSTGEFTVTFDNLGDAVPAAVLFVMAGATALDTPAADVMMSIGYSAGPGTGNCLTIYSQDNQGTTNTKSAQKHNGIVLFGAGSADGGYGSASIVEFGSGTVKLNCTQAFGAAHQCAALAISGAGMTAEVTPQPYPLMGAAGSTTPMGVAGADIAMLLTAFNGWESQVSGVNASLGFANADGQRGYMWHDSHNVDETNVEAWTGPDGRIGRALQKDRAQVGIVNLATNPALYVTVGNINERSPLMLLRLPEGARSTVEQQIAPTSTGSRAYSLGYEPGALVMWGGLNRAGNVQTAYDRGASAFWIGFVTDNGSAFFCATSKAQAATSDTQTWTGADLEVYRGNDTEKVLDGTVTLSATGYNINWATTSDVVFNVLALEKVAAAEGSDPIVDFVVSPPFGYDLDQFSFFSTTNDNGNTITGYRWDLGDGTIVEGADLSTYLYYYGRPDIYDITLTVTTAGGEYSRTKAGAVVVNPTVEERDYIVSPLVPNPLGVNYDTPTYAGLRPGGLLQGIISYQLTTTDLRLSAAPEETTEVYPGVVRVVYDDTTGDLKLLREDGATATIDLTWTGGGGTGGTAPDAPALSDISNGDNDGNYTVSWGAVSGVESYTLQEKEGSGGTWAAIYTGSSTSYAVTDRTEATWYYRVSATDNDTGLTSAWSTEKTATVVGVTLFEKSVVTGSDDAFEFSGGTTNLTNTFILLDAAGEDGGLRFTNVTIPQGATISSAVLELYVEGLDDPNLSIDAEDTDDASTFTTTNGNVGGRTRTTANVTWNAANIGTNAVATSPDISTVIQEIVDRAGWASGNAIAIILTANTGCDFRFTSFEGTNAAPKLIVEYS